MQPMNVQKRCFISLTSSTTYTLKKPTCHLLQLSTITIQHQFNGHPICLPKAYVTSKLEKTLFVSQFPQNSSNSNISMVKQILQTCLRKKTKILPTLYLFATLFYPNRIILIPQTKGGVTLGLLVSQYQRSLVANRQSHCLK